MFRVFLRGIASRKPSNGLCMKFIRNESTANQQQLRRDTPKPEKLDVTLCGIIDRKPFINSDGAIAVNLRTCQPNNEHYALHRIVLRTETMKRVLANRLAEGVRLYVNGLITYTDFTTADNKARRWAHIMALDAYVCERLPDGNDESFDLNDVKLFGQVINLSRDVGQLSYLDVATTFFDRKECVYKLKIHSLRIFDQSLRDLARSLDVGAKVIANGQIATRTVETNAGQKVTVASIQPYSLFACNYIRQSSSE